MVAKPGMTLYGKAAIAIIAMVGFAYLGRHYFSEVARIRDARLAGIVAIAVIHAVTLWLQGMTLRLGLQPFGNHITGKQGFALSVMGSYANLLIPRSGIAATAAYLKKQCQTKLVDFSSIVLYNAALFIFCSSLVALAIVVGTSSRGAAPQWWLFPSLAVLSVTAWLAVIIRWRMPASYRGFGSHLLGKLCHASSKLVDSANFWPLLSLNLALTFIRAARLYVAFWALAIDVDPLGVILASVLGDLVFIFAVTPAALGFREAAITFSASAMATSASLALSVAIFDRIIFSGTVVILAQIIITWFVGQGGHAATASSPSQPIANPLEGLGK